MLDLNMKKGFTLVELLIVIAIMGILTSITVSQFVTAKKKANDVSRKSDLNGISKALQMYYADYNEMPAMSAVNGGKMVVKGVTVDWGGQFIDGTYIYMKTVPRENNSSLNPYCYKTDANKKKYAIFAQLENLTDKECVGNYSCGGRNGYCFAYVSGNTSLDAGGNLL